MSALESPRHQRHHHNEHILVYLDSNFPSTLWTFSLERVPRKLKIPGVMRAVIVGATKGTQWAYSEGLKYVWVSEVVLAGWCCKPVGKLRFEAFPSFVLFCYRVRRSTR